MNPNITIIIPIYKVEKYLEDCLKSVINQTYKNFKCILINDCSPDNCGDICNKYKKLDNRFIVIHKEKNEGLSEARNTGLNLVDTEYVCFIDSDDFVHPKYIEILYNTIINYNCEVAECDFLSIKESTTFDSLNFYNKINISNNCNVIKSGIERIQDFFNDFSYYMTMNKIFLYDSIKNYRFIKNIWFEDVAYSNELYLNLNRIVLIPFQLYFYRQRPGSIMDRRYEEEKGLDILDVWYNSYILYKEKNVNNRLLNSIANFLWDTFFFTCRDAVRKNFMTKERSKKIYTYLTTLDNDNRYPTKEFFRNIYLKYKELNGDIFKFFNSK